MDKERILVGGREGTSKTWSFLKIVSHNLKGRHVALEVDDGFEKLLNREFPEIPSQVMDYDPSTKTWAPRPSIQNKGNVLTVFHCRGFREVLAAQREIEKLVASGEMKAGDWLCIDGADLIYNNMRYELIERGLAARRANKQSTDEDAWEAAIEQRARGAPLLEGGDWDMIHSFYERLLDYCATKVPMHFYCSTSISVLDSNSPYEQDDVKEFYASLGVSVKFEGQKRTPRLFDTLIAFKRNPQSYTANIWKDRGAGGRPMSKNPRHSAMMDYTNNDFYADIGVKLLGWPAS